MKKYFLVIIISLLLVVGCSKSESMSKSTAEIGSEYDLDIDANEGRFQIVCVTNSIGKKGEEYTTIETTYYDEYQFMINKKVKTINKYTDLEEYKSMKKQYIDVELEDTETTRYRYKTYDKERTFVWVSVEDIDRSLAKEDDLTAKYYLIQHNEEKYKCAIKGVSLKDLGF